MAELGAEVIPPYMIATKGGSEGTDATSLDKEEELTRRH